MLESKCLETFNVYLIFTSGSLQWVFLLGTYYMISCYKTTLCTKTEAEMAPDGVVVRLW